MKHNAKYTMALLALLLAACHPDKKELVSMTARMENVSQEDEQGSKTYLTNDERWVCWEDGDYVAICPEEYTGSHPFPDDKDTVHFPVTDGVGTMEALFSREINKEAYSAIFNSPITLFSPPNLDPRPKAGTNRKSWIITIPQKQPYRETVSPDPDHTFSPSILPMVAYSGSGFNVSYNYFHPVSGILRLQFYSSGATDVTIDSIFIESHDSPISGPFELPVTNGVGVPAIEDPEPFITPSGTPTARDYTLTVTDINKPVGGTNQDKIHTFYVPIPATKDLTLTQSDPLNYYTDYKLRVTVFGHRTASNVKVQCKKILNAKIHRCNITKMRALDLTNFVEDGNGTSSVQLVGCGTEDRPFQIYTLSDLAKVRDAFKLDIPRVNGQRVRGMGHPNGPTYFKISRSDIVIPNDSIWIDANCKGISNFKGYMYMETPTSNLNYVTNNSRYALFHSISDSGLVEGVRLDGNIELIARSDEFSPFCYENNGTIRNCHNNCNVIIDQEGSYAKHLAGLCAINHGKIIGGANNGNLRSDSSNVAGICYKNDGRIEGSFTMSHAKLKGKNIAGVCYYNSNVLGLGVVTDCVVSSSTNPVNTTGNVGVIVFENHGTVSDCRSSGSLIFTTVGSIGGIVNTNYGIVKNCSNTVTMEGCNTSVGGIVAINMAGEVYNCDNEGDHYIMGTNGTATATYAGGIVGWLKGGKIANCFNECEVSMAITSGGIVGKIEMTAWAQPADRPVQNCYCGFSKRLHGYIHDTICKVGFSCFSTNGGDFDTLYGCNLFSETSFNITRVLPTYKTWTGNTIDVNSSLVTALNYWVNNCGSAGKYWSWKVNSDEIMPRFNNPNYTKRKGKVQKAQTFSSRTKKKRR